jgi:tetratricopeptide (TPR) repeat protein
MKMQKDEGNVALQDLTPTTRTTKQVILWLSTASLLGGAAGFAFCSYFSRYQERIQFDAHMLSAARALQEQNPEDAKFHLHVAIALDEHRYAPYFNLATVYTLEGRPEIAKRMLERALENIRFPQEAAHGQVEDRVVQADKVAIENALAKLKAD